MHFRITTLECSVKKDLKGVREEESRQDEEAIEVVYGRDDNVCKGIMTHLLLNISRCSILIYKRTK